MLMLIKLPTNCCFSYFLIANGYVKDGHDDADVDDDDDDRDVADILVGALNVSFIVCTCICCLISYCCVC